MVSTEFTIPCLFITHATHMTEEKSILKRLEEISKLDEARLMVDFHQTIRK